MNSVDEDSVRSDPQAVDATATSTSSVTLSDRRTCAERQLSLGNQRSPTSPEESAEGSVSDLSLRSSVDSVPATSASVGLTRSSSRGSCGRKSLPHKLNLDSYQSKSSQQPLQLTKSGAGYSAPLSDMKTSDGDNRRLSLEPMQINDTMPVRDSVRFKPANSFNSRPSDSQGSSTMPIRYVLEFVDAPPEGASDQSREDYAIIASAIPLSQLKSALLAKCGLEHLAAHECSAYVCVKNWRPLPLESLVATDACDPCHVSVAEALGAVAGVITLRLVCQWALAAGRAILRVQQRVLQLLVQQQQQQQQHSARGAERLQRMGCPLDQSQIELLASSEWRSFPLEAATRFDRWYNSLTASVTSPALAPVSVPPQSANEARPPSPNTDKLTPQVSKHVENSNGPRMRTTFDMEFEMPKLQKWFCTNAHPNRAQMQYYMDQLNVYRTARQRRPLALTNIFYWFKNARAAHKKLLSDQQMMDDCDAAAASVTSQRQRPCLGENSSCSTASSCSDREGDEAAAAEQVSVVKRERFESEPESDGERSCLPAEQQQQQEEEAGADDCEETESMSPLAAAPTQQSLANCAGTAAAAGGFSLPGSYMGTMGLGYAGMDPAVLHQSVSMYMSGCLAALPGYTPPPITSTTPSSAHLSAASSSTLYGVEQFHRKRNRTFIDPVSEVPLLERWFVQNTHPCHSTILHYTDQLNRQSYRQRFPPLEPKNVQFWFKNRRAKTKRLRSGSLSNECDLFAGGQHHRSGEQHSTPLIGEI